MTVPADDYARDAVDALRAEPEPGWADEIRRGRRDRAARLRSMFASFDDDDERGDDGSGGATTPIARDRAMSTEEPRDP